MLIPSVTEASLRTAKVYAYDPFAAETAPLDSLSFLTTYPYAVGDQIFDGTNYQTVTAVTDRSGSSTPLWATAISALTVSGGVTFRNDGPVRSSRYFFAASDAIRIARNSAAFVRITFPDTITPAVETATLHLDCACFDTRATSRMIFNPTVSVRPAFAQVTTELIAIGEVIPPFIAGEVTANYATDADLLALASLRAAPTVTSPVKVRVAQAAASDADLSVTPTLRHAAETGLSRLSSQMVIGTFNLSRVSADTDIYSQSFPETWPPAYLDLAATETIPMPSVGDVTFDLTPFLDPAVRTYTFLLYRADPVVRTATGVTRAENEPVPFHLAASDSGQATAHVLPLTNQRHPHTEVGGPYLGYILDTYETVTGITRPIPWFETSEAKRLAVTLTATNFFAEEEDVEVEVLYNSASQQFVLTQIDHRFDGLDRLRGIRTELRRIDPVRIGNTLLYPLASYDLPWLIAKPEQIGRLTASTRAARAALASDAALADERHRLKATLAASGEAASWGYVDEG